MKNINLKLVFLNFGLLVSITISLFGQDCEIDSFVLNNYFTDAELLAIREIQTTDDHEFKDSVFVPIALRDKYLKIISSIFNFEGSTYKDSIFTNFNIHVLDLDQMIRLKTDTTFQWVKDLKTDSAKSGNNLIDTILTKYSLKMVFSQKESISLKSKYKINYKALIDEFTLITGVTLADLINGLVLIVPGGCEDKLPDDIELINNYKTLRFIRTMDACPDNCFTRKFWEFSISDYCNIDHVRSYCNNQTNIDQSNNFDQLKIYPNPFLNSITISNHTPVDNIKIFDSSGSIIYQDNPQNTMIDLKRLTNGIYFIELITRNDSKIYKIIKL